MNRLLFWGLILLLFVLVVVAAVALVDWLLWLAFRRVATPAAVHRLWWAVDIAIVVSLLGVLAYGHWVTRFEIEVNRVAVTSTHLPAGFDGFRIVQISDFHIDSFDAGKDDGWMDELTDSIFAQKPDIICFTGDLVTMQADQAEPWRDKLAAMAAQKEIPVYAILGNHDYADYPRGFTPRQRVEDRERLHHIIYSAGWQLLENEHVILHRGGDSILLAGVGNVGEPPFSNYGDLKRAIGSSAQSQDATDATRFKILLSHNPTHWRSEALGAGIDLMLAGHTHAMQLRIGDWSPVKYRYSEWGGLYNEGEQYLYVNTGLGCTGWRARIGVPPEVTLVVLREK